MSQQGGGIPTLDQANIKKIIDLITFPAGQLFRDELSLDDSLNKLDNFFVKTTEKESNVPVQFSKASEVEFKISTRAIARSLGSFRKIALYEMQEMTRLKSSQYETQKGEGYKMQEQTQDVKFSEDLKKEGFVEKLTKPFQREEPTFNLVRNSIAELTKFQAKYENWLHWYWLACRKRSKINTRKAMDQILENMIIFFNTFLEPNLLMAQSYAHDIARGDMSRDATISITAYLMGKQRSNNPMLALQSPQ